MDMTALAFFSTAHTFTALPALAAACSSRQNALHQKLYMRLVTKHIFTALLALAAIRRTILYSMRALPV